MARSVLFTNRMPSSKERRIRLLKEDNSLTDCAFLVGDPKIEKPQLFHCHKMVLATSSEVFERMFYSKFDDMGPVSVPEVSPTSFERFLRYVYIYEFDNNKLITNEVVELLYLSDKYMIQDLTDTVVEYLRNKHNWTLHDVWPMYNWACLNDNLPLLLQCYSEIGKYKQTLFSEDSFFDVDVAHLKRLVILLSQQQHIPTITVFKTLEEYGKRNKLTEKRDTEQYSKLEEAVDEVDFKKLSMHDFKTVVVKSYLFENVKRACKYYNEFLSNKS